MQLMELKKYSKGRLSEQKSVTPAVKIAIKIELLSCIAY